MKIRDGSELPRMKLTIQYASLDRQIANCERNPGAQQIIRMLYGLIIPYTTILSLHMVSKWENIDLCF